MKGQERTLVDQTDTGTVRKDETGPLSIRPTQELFEMDETTVDETNKGAAWKDEKGPSLVRQAQELFEKMRKGHRQSNQHRICLKRRDRASVNQTNTGTL